MNKPVVLVDMDGVLADFNTEVLARLSDIYPDMVIPELRYHKIHYNLENTEMRDTARSIAKARGFFASLPLIDGALDGWQQIIDLGYQPRICSAPLSDNPWCEEEKRSWLAQHFGIDVAKNAIIDKAKYRHDGIALIDDRTDLAHTDQASWQQILFDQPYNQSENTNLRLRGWKDPQLPLLLEQCRALQG